MVDRYVEGRSLAAATEESYRYHLRKYLARFRNRAMADISRSEARDLFETLKARSGLTTASGVMRTLRALFNEAKRYDETITSNPVDSLRVPLPKRREIDEIDLPAWWAKVSAVTPIRRDLHVFLMLTGLRRKSATTIRRSDVDLTRGIIRVRHMKSGRPFLLPLSNFLVELLRKRMAEDEPIASEWLWPSPTSKCGHVVEPREDGLPSAHVYRHLWRTYAIAAGVPYAESALLLDQRLPGASGGYVHAEHLSEQLRRFQEMVSSYLLGRALPTTGDEGRLLAE